MDGGSAGCICPWMDGSRTMHMYRTYCIRAMQELLPRSSCRGAVHLSIQLICLGLSRQQCYDLFEFFSVSNSALAELDRVLD